MDADHAGVCKFSAADNDNYKQVAFNLAELVNEALETAGEKSPVPTPRACMYSLRRITFQTHTGDVIGANHLVLLCSRARRYGQRMPARSTVYRSEAG
jgi:hypothetical protein